MSVEDALSARTDLDVYESGKRTLYALQLALRIEDVHSIAATALTDGPDDKSCDLVYVDRDAGQLVIAQGYESSNPDAKTAASSAKAASLNQAVTWLLSQEGDLPERLVDAAREVHEAFDEGAIQQVQIWMVHNLPESDNVRRELEATCGTARRIIEHRYPNAVIDSVIPVEVGRTVLDDWYMGSQTPILVTDDITINVTGAYEEDGDGWRAICTSVDATWLHSLMNEYGERIFSANVRGYLGSTRSRRNINNGIKDTAVHEQARFWAYNNGITALVHGFEWDSEARRITLKGLAIVNGAQTTGAIASVDRASLAGARVLARFIECGDVGTVRNIIRFNNRQNPTEASDFRSNDRVQTRLIKEFEQLGVIGYSGGRRGGAEDVIRRPADNQISATVAAQALASFHREPGLAYHEKGQIWENNKTYDRFFSDATTAEHVLFAYSLLRAVEQARQEAVSKPEAGRTESERRLVSLLRLRGSNFLVAAAVADCIEIYLNRQVPDRFRVRFKGKVTLPDAIAAWRTVLTPALSLAPDTLGKTLEREGSLRRREAVDEAIGKFRALFEATRVANSDIYAAFAKKVAVD